MKNECSIIRDLLPLYAENMVSTDTAAFVEEHLTNCEACRKEYEETKEPQPTQALSDAAPLKKLGRKLKIKRIQTIAVTAVFVIALFVSAFAVLDAPAYFPYTDGIVTAGVIGDKGMLLTFDEKVTDFTCTVYADPDGGEFYYCDIEAWTSLWDQWLSHGKGTLSYTVTTEKPWPVNAVYVPNNGTENVGVARFIPGEKNRVEKYESNGGVIALPRLALGIYLIFAIAALIILGIIWFLTRKKPEIRVWIERIALYPIAYIISHYIVSGIDSASYSMPRDFFLIIFISVLLYSGLLLLHNVWRLKKEIREVNQSSEKTR